MLCNHWVLLTVASRWFERVSHLQNAEVCFVAPTICTTTGSPSGVNPPGQPSRSEIVILSLPVRWSAPRSDSGPSKTPRFDRISSVMFASRSQSRKRYTAIQVVPPMKVKLFVIVVAALLMIGIAIFRSRLIKKTLPISPGVFDEVEKAKRP